VDDDTLHRLTRAERPAARIDPLDDHVTIEPTSDEHETRGGLIIPATPEVAVRSGVVLAVGDDVDGVRPGDKVLFPRAAAFEIRLGAEPVMIVRRRDLIARYVD
jgi:chaperonin GroES